MSSNKRITDLPFPAIQSLARNLSPAEMGALRLAMAGKETIATRQTFDSVSGRSNLLEAGKNVEAACRTMKKALTEYAKLNSLLPNAFLDTSDMFDEIKEIFDYETDEVKEGETIVKPVIHLLGKIVPFLKQSRAQQTAYERRIKSARTSAAKGHLFVNLIFEQKIFLEHYLREQSSFFSMYFSDNTHGTRIHDLLTNFLRDAPDCKFSHEDIARLRTLYGAMSMHAFQSFASIQPRYTNAQLTWFMAPFLERSV